MSRVIRKLKREIADARASVQTALKRAKKTTIKYRRREKRSSKYVNTPVNITGLSCLEKYDLPRPMVFLL
jgi:hypothetical protein